MGYIIQTRCSFQSSTHQMCRFGYKVSCSCYVYPVPRTHRLKSWQTVDLVCLKSLILLLHTPSTSSPTPDSRLFRNSMVRLSTHLLFAALLCAGSACAGQSLRSTNSRRDLIVRAINVLDRLEQRSISSLSVSSSFADQETLNDPEESDTASTTSSGRSSIQSDYLEVLPPFSGKVPKQGKELDKWQHKSKSKKSHDRRMYYLYRWLVASEDERQRMDPKFQVAMKTLTGPENREKELRLFYRMNAHKGKKVKWSKEMSQWWEEALLASSDNSEGSGWLSFLRRKKK